MRPDAPASEVGDDALQFRSRSPETTVFCGAFSAAIPSRPLYGAIASATVAASARLPPYRCQPVATASAGHVFGYQEKTVFQP